MLSKPKAPATYKDQGARHAFVFVAANPLIRIVSQSGLGPGVPLKAASEDTVSGRSPLGRQ